MTELLDFAWNIYGFIGCFVTSQWAWRNVRRVLREKKMLRDDGKVLK